MEVGEWRYSLDFDEPCRVLETETLWGEAAALVWLPRQGRAARVLQRRIEARVPGPSLPLEAASYAAAGARILDGLARDDLVAPLEGTVIPLPHQLYALQRAMAADRMRFLLADEVGLGKTIEAGLIFRELKIRGLVKRALVVAPAGLVTQWVSELKTHFGENFRLVLPKGLSALRDASEPEAKTNPWMSFDQVVCPLDSVKPMDARRGWSQEQLQRYNRERFEDLLAADWDIIIIDEAHRLGGSTEQVARFKLGDALAKAAPYLLLLSATPHQGKSDAFRRLIGFLDPEALPEGESITRERVAPYVVRTEKRHAIDAQGRSLFQPRVTQLVPVEWTSAHAEHQALYEAVTEYVRDGYNRARAEKQEALGFLMILMQRLVTSSTAAIRTALERRLDVLELPEGQLSLFGEDVAEEWEGLDGQEQLEAALKAKLRGLADERSEVELLLSAARRCEARAPDAKAEALLAWIQRLQREEDSPDIKVLVFTEFVPTQAMLADYLGQRGFVVVCLNGSLDLDERRDVQQRFSEGAQVLISTDAGGEGLNLQFCHVVVNFDLPWNPMKLEQRIGRVDRIGQKHVVRALNFALQDTVELRVRDVLEEKLQLILEEFGVDKLSDVLDSEEEGGSFERLFVQAVLSPADAERRAEALAEEVRRRAKEAREGAKLFGLGADIAPDAAKRVADHQLPFWTERMTLSYLKSQEHRGAGVSKDDVGYRLRWPDGQEVRRAVFRREDAEDPSAVHLSLENSQVRALTQRLPLVVHGQAVPAIYIPGLSDKVKGLWSLWRIGLEAAERREQRFLPVFVTDDGRALAPTARTIWDRLIELDSGIRLETAAASTENTAKLYEQSRDAALAQGAVIFGELAASHSAAMQRQRRKGSQMFAARRRIVERVALPQVRVHRLAKLEEEQRIWSSNLAASERAVPELTAMMLLQLVGEGSAS